MSTIDVRKIPEPSTVNELVFGDHLNHKNTVQGSTLSKEYCGHDGLAIRDGEVYILIDTTERAQHLILALQKAIELEWVK